MNSPQIEPSFSPLPSARRSGLVTALGVVTLLAGIFTISPCGLLLHTAPWISRQFAAARLDPQGQDLRIESLLHWVVRRHGTSLGFAYATIIAILGVPMIAAGIGTIRRKRWARTTTLTVAAIGVAWGLAGLVMFFAIVFAIAQIVYAIAAFAILLDRRITNEFV